VSARLDGGAGVRERVDELGARLARFADRAAGFARARLLLHGARLGRRVWVGGPLRFTSEGEVVIGDQVNLCGGIIPSELRCGAGGRLEIGDACIFNYGAFIDARASIRIGRRCSFGSFVHIADATGGPRGAHGRSGPIVIGDDVWIAHGAVIEPGVTIGAGSVVSAGSVVVADVPAGSLAIGNPARSMSLKLVGGEGR
jgi:maltose O-acetyltransferase